MRYDEPYLRIAIVLMCCGCGRSGFDSQRGSDGSTDSSGDARDETLVADWPFDDQSGTTVLDISGHGHVGATSGGMWIAGHSGTALLLNGTSDFVSVPASPEFDRPAGANFTITTWFQRTGIPNHSMLASVSYGTSNAAYALELQSDTVMNYWDGIGHIASAPVSLPLGQWVHAAVVVSNGINVRLFLNAVPINGAVADETPRTATLVLLGTSNYGDHLPGALDQTRFYRRALSDLEVSADMNR